MRCVALLMLFALTACAQPGPNQYNATANNFSRYMQCLGQYGGTDNRLASVPKENIVAAVSCVNNAEIQAIFPTYHQLGYDTSALSAKQSKLLGLAKLREKGEISANRFEAKTNQIIADADAYTNRSMTEVGQQHTIQQAQSRPNNLCDNQTYMLGMNMMAGGPNDPNYQMARAQIDACAQMRGQRNSSQNAQSTHSATTMTGFFLRRQNSNIPTKQTCVYSYMGKEVGLLYPATGVCPMNVEM